MEVTHSQQLSTLLISFITGAFLGAIYDCVRILRCILGVEYYGKSKYFKLINLKSKEKGKIRTVKENIVMLITDVLFFIFCGISIAIIVYYANSGIIRWYIFVFCLLGFLIYYFTIGKLVITVADTVATAIRAFFSCIVYLLVFPLKPVYPLTKKLLLLLKIRLYKQEEKKEVKNKVVLINYGNIK